MRATALAAGFLTMPHAGQPDCTRRDATIYLELLSRRSWVRFLYVFWNENLGVGAGPDIRVTPACERAAHFLIIKSYEGT